MYSTHGTVHERNDRSVLPCQIDALQRSAGWELTDGVRVRFECALPDGTKSDDVFSVRSGRPLAALETKCANTNPLRRRPRA